MRSVRSFRILPVSVCLLLLASVALTGCDEPNGPTLTQVSIPETPALTQVQVPDVVGMNNGDARTALQSLGLNADAEFAYVLVEDPENLSSSVIAQDPAAGTWVHLFSTVAVTLEVPGEYLPDLVGMSEADAQLLLSEGQGDSGHWHSTSIYAVTSLSEWWGIVMAQTPGPGVLWGNYPPVTLVVGTGTELESVTTLSIPHTSPTPGLTTTTTLPTLVTDFPPLSLPTTTTTGVD